MSATVLVAKPKVAPLRSASLPHAEPRPAPKDDSRGAALPVDQTRTESHTASVGGELSSDHAPAALHPESVAAELLFHAAFLDDIENVRKATANRLGAMDRQGVGGSQYQSQLDALEKIEHQAVLALQRSMRKHPLGPWVKRTVGVGEKQAARLLAAIGDVTWNHAENRPRRGPAELWAYCGYRPDQRRRKGVQSNWNADAKTRAYLIAESCIKQAHSPYRAVYDTARASWADRDTSDGHKHNHALRCVAKAVLRDLFLEARRVSWPPTDASSHSDYGASGANLDHHDEATAPRQDAAAPRQGEAYVTEDHRTSGPHCSPCAAG